MKGTRIKMRKNIFCAFVAAALLLSSCSSEMSNTTADTSIFESIEDTENDTVNTDSEQTDEQTSAETDAPTAEYAFNEMEINRTIHGKYVSLLDVDSNTVLFEKGGFDSKIYPASTTKLITALVALENCSLDEIFTAGDELDLVQPHSSLAYILKGMKLDVDTLIAAMLLPSGNDAAYVIAAGTGKIIAKDKNISDTKAVEIFVREMNAFAKRNGMTGSSFTCPDGFHDENHYTTMRDMMTVAKLAIKDETIMKYAGTFSDKFYYASGESMTWTNTNSLIDPYSDLYYEYATGLKTGTTDEAGACIVAVATLNGKTVIACVYAAEKSNDRFSDAKILLRAGLSAE